MPPSAPDALVSAFGGHLATTSAITEFDEFFHYSCGHHDDARGQRQCCYNVPMYSVSALQVNYYVPAGVASGPATMTIDSADGVQTIGTILVARPRPVCTPPIRTARGWPPASRFAPASALATPLPGIPTGSSSRTPLPVAVAE